MKKKTAPKNAPDSSDVQLGGRLAAAVISHQLGVGVDYALRRYVPAAIDPSWIELGRVLLRHSQDAIFQNIALATRDGKPQWPPFKRGVTEASLSE